MYRINKIILSSDGTWRVERGTEWHGCPPGGKSRLQAGRKLRRIRNKSRFGNSETDMLRHVYGLIQYEYHNPGHLANQPKEKIEALLEELNEVIKKTDSAQQVM